MPKDIRENYEIRESIRDRLVAEYEGRRKRCLECGNIITDPTGVCQCGDMDGVDEWEPVGLLEDDYVYDIEYCVGGDLDYRSVALMIAGGGPTIYIDTGKHAVTLSWGSDEAYAWLPSEVSDEIDSYYIDIYEEKRS